MSDIIILELFLFVNLGEILYDILYIFLYLTVERLLSFKTAFFGPMALLQDSHINMPFQSWEVRPCGINHAKMTIIAAIVEIEIQIKVHVL